MEGERKIDKMKKKEKKINMINDMMKIVKKYSIKNEMKVLEKKKKGINI